MIDKLIKVQNELKAPKNQRNNFGKYNYRNCEDILEAVKPLLFKHGLLLTVADEIKETPLGIYVVASTQIPKGVSFISSATVKSKPGLNSQGFTSSSMSSQFL